MKTMRLRLLRRRDLQRGTTATEYALLISALALVIVTAAFTLGDDLSERLTQMASIINS